MENIVVENFLKTLDGGYIILSNSRDLKILYSSEVFNKLVVSKKPTSLLDYLDETSKCLLLSECSLGYDTFSIDCTLVSKSNVTYDVIMKFKREGFTFYVTIMQQRERREYLKNLEVEHNRLVAILKITDSLIIEIDSLGIVSYITESFKKEFQILRLRDIEQLFSNPTFIFQADRPILNNYINSSKKFVTNEKLELRLKTEFGYKWFRLEITPVCRNNMISSIILNFEDIDDYKTRASILTLKAVKDELTGCFNKAYLLSTLGQKKLNGSLIFFDIDNFKGINDTYGHMSGDVALKGISICMQSTFGDCGILCRFGGDEFCIYTELRDKGMLTQRLGTLLKEVKQIPINEDKPVSISIGYSVSEGSSTLEELMKHADLALYYSKEHGKDSFNLYSDVKTLLGD